MGVDYWSEWGRSVVGSEAATCGANSVYGWNDGWSGEFPVSTFKLTIVQKTKTIAVWLQVIQKKGLDRETKTYLWKGVLDQRYGRVGMWHLALEVIVGPGHDRSSDPWSFILSSFKPNVTVKKALNHKFITLTFNFFPSSLHKWSFPLKHISLCSCVWTYKMENKANVVK
jgi:hypothetical protein